jgi:7-cyano-7-deazaguanine reductase
MGGAPLTRASGPCAPGVNPIKGPMAKKSKKIPARAEEQRGSKMIREAELERFPNRTKKRKYTIEFTCPEFTCLCPKTGFPDFATIFIRYSPDEWCVELKSLKLYINKFRDQGVFHEDVTNIIADDIIELLDPAELEVIADFNVRGNIHTLVTVQHSKSSVKFADDAEE